MTNEKRLIDANAFPKSWMLAQFTEVNGKMRLIRTKRLQDVPTVDAVEVVHGRWEVIEASDELYKCSVCGEWQYIPEEHFAYCPYCGAKMDGGNEDG